MIAASAQAYAATCPTGHSGNPLYGENLAWGWPSETVQEAMADWVGENTTFTYSTTNSDTCSNVCGHYTQIVWATTSSVGCGKMSCSNLYDYGPGDVYVCQFSVLPLFFISLFLSHFHSFFLVLDPKLTSILFFSNFLLSFLFYHESHLEI